MRVWVLMLAGSMVWAGVRRCQCDDWPQRSVETIDADRVEGVPDPLLRLQRTWLATAALDLNASDPSTSRARLAVGAGRSLLAGEQAFAHVRVVATNDTVCPSLRLGERLNPSLHSHRPRELWLELCVAPVDAGGDPNLYASLTHPFPGTEDFHFASQYEGVDNLAVGSSLPEWSERVSSGAVGFRRASCEDLGEGGGGWIPSGQGEVFVAVVARKPGRVTLCAQALTKLIQL
jgi:hypothetical protein